MARSGTADRAQAIPPSPTIVSDSIGLAFCGIVDDAPARRPPPSRHLGDLAAGEVDDLQGDPARGRRRYGQRRGEAGQAVPDAVPRHVVAAEAEDLRGAAARLGAERPVRRRGACRPVQLDHLGGGPRLVEAHERAADLLQPTGDLHAERDRDSLLAVRATRHRCGPVRLGEGGQGIAQSGADFGQIPAGLPQQQHQRRVHDVLRRGAVVQVGRHFRARAGQLLQQRQDRVAHQSGALAELREVDLDGPQLPLDGLGRRGGDHAVIGLRPRQRHLHLQPGGHRAGGQERLGEPRFAEGVQQGKPYAHRDAPEVGAGGELCNRAITPSVGVTRDSGAGW